MVAGLVVVIALEKVVEVEEVIKAMITMILG